MTQPLCDYFISSSHNTYLIADQVMGPSHLWGYTRYLDIVFQYFKCSLAFKKMNTKSNTILLGIKSQSHQKYELKM